MCLFIHVSILIFQITLKNKSKHNEKLELSSKLKENSWKRYYNPHVTKWKKDQNSLTVLNQDETGNFALGNIECKGEIKFVEEVEVPQIGHIEIPPKVFVKPPPDLQRRHPLFGQNVPAFPKALLCDKISSEEIKVEPKDEVKVKLEPEVGEKKKKKKKKKKSEES